jgi:hypothetical protein
MRWAGCLQNKVQNPGNARKVTVFNNNGKWYIFSESEFTRYNVIAIVPGLLIVGAEHESTFVHSSNEVSDILL